MSDFPHMQPGDFPGLPQGFPNNSFDYSKYDKTQMKITICAVPWDVGLIHVGNAQIGGLGNVVYFESKEARDAYFDSLESFSWETKYRDYHDGGIIEVPLPYEKSVLYNYAYCEYTTLPVDMAEGGKERFYFFIRSCDFIAPNNTKITVLRDTWQTYIYDVDISYMMLERGHAPIAETDVRRYLENPHENNSYLLAEDVNYGRGAMRHAMQTAIALNAGDMWAAIVTSADIMGEWAENVPTSNALHANGQPSYRAFAIEPQDLKNALDAIDEQVPQFKQTIKAVFFVCKDFVSVNGAVEFCGFQFKPLEPKNSDIDITTLAIEQFGYPDEYKDLAKLYTYPYAYLEISDDAGNVSEIRIEETSGNLSLQLTTSMAYPWLALDGRLLGVRGEKRQIVFSNVNEHTFEFGGDWYRYCYRWNIPTFAVTQSNAAYYDFSTRYDRAQAHNNAITAKANADRSAVASRDNALDSADAAKTNADRSAVASRDNAKASADAAKTNADRSAGVAQSNAKASATTAETNAKNTNRTNERNAKNSADTVYADSIDTANAAYDETVNSARTQNANALATNSMIKLNADDGADAAYLIGTNDAQANRTKFTHERALAHDYWYFNVEKRYDVGTVLDYLGYIGGNCWLNREKVGDDWDSDYIMQVLITGATINQTSLTAVTNGVGGAISTAVGGAAAGLVAGPGGSAVGAAAGIIGGAVSIGTAAASLPITVTTEKTVRDVALRAGEEKTDHALAYINKSAELTREYETDKYNAEQGHLTDIANLMKATADADATYSKNLVKGGGDFTGTSVRTKSANDANANRTLATALENAETAKEVVTGDGTEQNIGTAQRDKETAYTNAGNTKTTAHNNADATHTAALANNALTKTTADGNADREYAKDIANNALTKTTADGNADRTCETALTNNAANYNNALDAIQNGINQAALDTPHTFGEYSNGETSTTRPQALFCNLVTQLEDEIAQTGDYFLRFGYAVNRYWEFDGFNKMPYFTYWKVKDMSIRGNNVPDAYLDEIRFYLMGGVCVWRDPADIGRVSIYENR